MKLLQQIKEDASPYSPTFRIEHYQAAFQQYGKSIHGMRKSCADGERSKRLIRIAHLLALCFEYFYGNIEIAIAHVKNGIKLSGCSAINSSHFQIGNILCSGRGHPKPQVTTQRNFAVADLNAILTSRSS